MLASSPERYRRKDISVILRDIDADTKLSARQRNVAKRQAKAKAAGKRPIVATPVIQATTSTPASAGAGAGAGAGAAETAAPSTLPKAAAPGAAAAGSPGGRAKTQFYRARFEHVYDELLFDLFDATWEVRHGAVIALREILKAYRNKTPASSSATSSATSAATKTTDTTACLHDIALRAVCIIVLDR